MLYSTGQTEEGGDEGDEKEMTKDDAKDAAATAVAILMTPTLVICKLSNTALVSSCPKAETGAICLALSQFDQVHSACGFSLTTKHLKEPPPLHTPALLLAPNSPSEYEADTETPLQSKYHNNADRCLKSNTGRRKHCRL